MTAKRRRLPAETKARIALAAIRGEKTVSELAADYQVHPVQISNWKKQLLEGAPGLFADRRTREGGSGRGRRQQQPPVEELYQQIGRLQFELEWLKKKSGGRD
jgi:transposase-like protein